MIPLKLVGGSYTARSKNFDASRTINYYPEASGSGMSKDIAYLVGCPGCRYFTQLPEYPIRGMLKITDSKAIVVAGQGVYALDNLGAFVRKGSISPGSTPVSMATNGQQVLLVTGSTGYTIDLAAQTVTQITDPVFTGADKVAFLDGFFVFNIPGTQKFQITKLYATDLDALDFASAEGSPDLLVSLIADHEQLWLFGQNSTEVWDNTGGLDFPFSRISGAFIEQGCVAKNSVAKLDNTVIWLAGDDRGVGTVQRSVGFTPTRISDHALEYAIQGYSRIDDAVAYTYQSEGHIFYVLTFPSGNATWAYDTTTSLWHQRAYRDPHTGSLNRHRSICQMAFANKTLVGDWQNGTIYSLDLDCYTDNGDILPAIRQFPHETQGNSWQFFKRLWVDVEVGYGASQIQTLMTYSGWSASSTTFPTADDNSRVYAASDGLPVITNNVVNAFPQVMLEWSDDGGHSFGNRQLASLGQIGERNTRVIFRRLGKSRDRVWRLTITDPVRRVLIGAQVDMATGAY